jgi:(2Fe-2S) ferredoxin
LPALAIAIILLRRSTDYASPLSMTNLHDGLAKAGIHGAERHLFLCIGPDCCRSDDGQALWEFVKTRVKECGLKVMRTKAGCFRICTGGPWLVVYPDGTWYGAVTPVRFDRILQEHLLGGEPVGEWIVMRNALGCRSAVPSDAQQPSR